MGGGTEATAGERSMRTIRCDTKAEFEQAHEAALTSRAPVEVRIELRIEGWLASVVEVHKAVGRTS